MVSVAFQPMAPRITTPALANVYAATVKTTPKMTFSKNVSDDIFNSSLLLLRECLEGGFGGGNERIFARQDIAR